MDKNILNKATSSDRNPTPGYLYGEIARMTQEGVVECDKIAQHLIYRLKKPNPNSKLKSLVVIKHVCRKGSPSFRRAIQAYISDVKACLQYRGTTDPLHGDEPNRKVREAAKEAVEAIFNSSTESANSALSNRIKGFGNSINPSEENNESTSKDSTFSAAYDTVLSASSSLFGTKQESSTAPMYKNERGFESRTGSKYGGIGNPNFQDPRNKPKGFLDKVKDRINEKLNDTQAKEEIPGWMSSGSGADGYNFANNRGSGNTSYKAPSEYDPTSTQRVSGRYDSTSSKTRTAGQVGGGWGSTGANNFGTKKGLQSFGSKGTGGGATDGIYERNQIDELCAASGVRAAPPVQKLRTFVQACKTLDPQVVMPILEEKMQASDWKVQHKALCVCEALIKDPNCEAYADYIDDNPELLEDLLESKQSSIRDRSRTVWKLLYGAESLPALEQPAAAKPKPVVKKKEPESDLLDFGDSPAELTEPTVSTTSLLDNNSVSLLDDTPIYDNVMSNAPVVGNVAPEAPTSSSLLDSLSTPAPAQPPSAGLFNGLNVGSAPQGTVEAKPNDTAGMTSMFDSMTVKENTIAGTPKTGFSFLSTPTENGTVDSMQNNMKATLPVDAPILTPNTQNDKSADIEKRISDINNLMSLNTQSNTAPQMPLNAQLKQNHPSNAPTSLFGGIKQQVPSALNQNLMANQPGPQQNADPRIQAMLMQQQQLQMQQQMLQQQIQQAQVSGMNMQFPQMQSNMVGGLNPPNFPVQKANIGNKIPEMQGGQTKPQDPESLARSINNAALDEKFSFLQNAGLGN